MLGGHPFWATRFSARAALGKISVSAQLGPAVQKTRAKPNCNPHAREHERTMYSMDMNGPPSQTQKNHLQPARTRETVTSKPPCPPAFAIKTSHSPNIRVNPTLPSSLAGRIELAPARERMEWGRRLYKQHSAHLERLKGRRGKQNQQESQVKKHEGEPSFQVKLC